MDAPHIWIPKVKIIERELVMPPTKLEGYFTIEACNRYGQVQRSHTWKQLITNLGMDTVLAQTNPQTWNFGSYVAVGTGSPTFTNASTGLSSFLARSNASTSGSPVESMGNSGAGYRYQNTHTKEFTLGAVVGNLTEVGWFSAANNSSGIYLDLIRDSGGSPTTFPVTSADLLRVTHTLYVYPYITDVSSSFTLGGTSGDGAHTYTARWFNPTLPVGSGGEGSTFFWNFAAPYAVGVHRDCTLANIKAVGAAGGFSTSPATGGTYLDQVTATASAISTSDNITWTRTSQAVYGLTVANHANGITAIASNRAAAIFTPKIDKFAGSVQRILTMNFSGSCTRI